MLPTTRLVASVVLAMLASCASRERATIDAPSAVVSEASRPVSDYSKAAPPMAIPAQGVLVKSGTVSLIVGNAKEAEDRIRALMQTYGAYISGRESTASVPRGKVLAPSETRSVTLTIKVDAKNFDVFLEKVKEVGSYISEQVRVDDITFAYTDLNARLANQRKVEERLLGYLSDPNRDYKLIIEVEKELARVREQIEQLSAQLRVMENQIAYSTLVVHMTVMPDYVPPEERTFWQQLGDMLARSLAVLLDTAKAAVIFGIAALPWVVVVGGGLWLLVKGWRRLRRRPS